MGEFCTCGAQLAPDARFCHKCGKPQFEISQPEPEEAPLETIRAELPAAPPPVPEVGFGNPQAVRVAVLVGLLSFFAWAISSAVPVLPMVWLLAAGFLSVYLYGRRTGQPITLRSGARLGWITGIFAFLIVLVLLTTVVLAISDPGIAAQVAATARARGMDMKTETILDAFRNPSAVFQMVVGMFILFTLLPTVGGLLGAKLLSGRSR